MRKITITITYDDGRSVDLAADDVLMRHVGEMALEGMASSLAAFHLRPNGSKRLGAGPSKLDLEARGLARILADN